MARSLLGSVLICVGLEFPPVAQADHDFAAAGDDVIIGKNDAGRIDDHARAAAGNTVRHVRHAMELMEELPQLRVFEHVAEGRALKPKGISSVLSSPSSGAGFKLREAFTTSGLLVIVTTAGKTCSAAA